MSKYRIIQIKYGGITYFEVQKKYLGFIWCTPEWQRYLSTHEDAKRELEYMLAGVSKRVVYEE